MGLGLKLTILKPFEGLHTFLHNLRHGGSKPISKPESNNQDEMEWKFTGPAELISGENGSNNITTKYQQRE